MKFINNNKTYSSENKIYNTSCLVAIVSCTIGYFFNNAINLTPIFNVVFSALIVAFGVLYYYGKFKQTFNTNLFVLFALIGLSIVYFLSEGSEGTVLIIYLLVLMSIIAMSKVRYHTIYFIAIVSNIILLIFLENQFYDELIVKYPSKLSKTIDTYFTYAACFFICFIIMRYFKKTQDNENEIIKKQKKELQDLIVTKDKFFSIVAHDLRGPLGAVMGIGKLMTEEASEFSLDDMRKMNLMMNKSLKNTNRLLENLLSWAKIQQGLINIEPKQIKLYSLIEKKMNSIKTPIKNKQINFHNNIKKSVTVFADENILKTVLRNLIANAVKFTPKGGDISISAKITSSNTLEISIKDSGIGMDKSLIENLFKLDVRTNRSGTDGEPSTGLGLLLCKEFVEMSGGKIWVESEENIGSNFKFTLPATSTN